MAKKKVTSAANKPKARSASKPAKKWFQIGSIRVKATSRDSAKRTARAVRKTIQKGQTLNKKSN